MKNTKVRRGIRCRRKLAFALAFTVLCSLLSGSVFASAPFSEYLCGHVHDGSCGYVQGSAGSPCTHSHDETCGYVEAAPCTYTHTHVELCGYCEGSTCTYTHTHNETCGYNAETGEGCTDVHSHDGTCGYMEAAPCTDVHVHDEACGYVEGSPCLHVHDEKCGYKDPVTAVSCNHVCNILSFNGYINGTALETCEAPAGSSYASICASLPATLEASLSCADCTVDVPVTWSCAEFTGAAGIYTFRASLNAAHCVYIASDDPATVDIDERALPFITVTLPEAPPTPEATASPSPSPSPISMLPTTLTEGAVTLTGELPEGAYLAVTEVPMADAEELLGETETNTVVLFAYDIKIMLPGVLDEATGERGEPAEFQPGAENPVTVTISPPKPIEAPTVEVVHIAEDADTGEKTPQSVATVTPAENTVSFEADEFSVYVVTMTATTFTVTFDYDDPSIVIEYSTDGLAFMPLTANVSVAAGTELYFRITAGENAFVWRDGAALTATDGVYAIDDISADTYIDVSQGIVFDLAKGAVTIDSIAYSGCNSAGRSISGAHDNSYNYKITQIDNTIATENNITLVGAASIPEFNVTLSGVNCDTSTTRISGGIIANAVASTPMAIRLWLEGNNSVGRIHYATGQGSAESVSSLRITSASGDGSTSGSLTVASASQWSAAIGGVDEEPQEAARNITIAGGTITATSTSTSAIGGGGNGVSDVLITGGSVTATNEGTGATIGGGGGRGLVGAAGYVTISGGAVSVTNNSVNGVALGAGGSVDSMGSNGTVNISGGLVTVVRGSIGGGSSVNATGGSATVNISGGRVTVADGNIGGGSGSTGGTATVNISGGTVVTPHISGGKNSDNTFRDATLSIAAASVNIADRSNINSVTGPDPDTGMSIVVYCQTIDVKALEGFSGGSGNITIQSANLSDGHSYPLKDVYSDSEGMLYFWLPTEYRVTGLKIGNTDYTVTDNAQTQIATITHDSSTVGSTLGAVLNFGTPTAYKWQISDNGSDAWSDIPGASSATYIVSSSDVTKYIRVVISTAEEDVISGSLRITDTPYARVDYTSLTAGSTLTAQLLNGTPSSYQWQRYNSVNQTWANISGAVNSAYQVSDTDVGKQLRVIIYVGTTSYTSSFVFIYSPSFTITIPESINAAAAGSFSIAGVLSHFASSRSVTVSYSSGNKLALTGAETNTLSYSLCTQGGTPIPTGGTVATFSGDGSHTIPIYYSISDIPIYSGTYTDTLTFTVTLN